MLRQSVKKMMPTSTMNIRSFSNRFSDKERAAEAAYFKYVIKHKKER